jgi:hypothetical protein
VDDLERKLDGEVDSVRLPGVSLNRVNAGEFVICPNLEAAVATECLVSGHVAADTQDLRLEAR